jgi:uncharacterized membrane protein
VAPLENNTPDNQPFDIDERRLMSALAYLGVLVFVPLLMRRDDPTIVWHIKQGLVILIGLVLALIAAAWNSAVGSFIFLLLIVVDIIALVQALVGQQWRIPIIGNLADKFRI